MAKVAALLHNRIVTWMGFVILVLVGCILVCASCRKPEQMAEIPSPASDTTATAAVPLGDRPRPAVTPADLDPTIPPAQGDKVMAPGWEEAPPTTAGATAAPVTSPEAPTTASDRVVDPLVVPRPPSPGKRVQPITRQAFAAVPAVPGVRSEAVPATAPMLRQGVAFPIQYTPERMRVNLQILTNYFVPEQTWFDPRFRETIGERGGEFPVKVWRCRKGTCEKVDTIMIAAAHGVFRQYRVGNQFQQGDVCVIEYNPGLFMVMQERSVLVPFASVIDNRSNDPVTLYGTLMRF